MDLQLFPSVTRNSHALKAWVNTDPVKNRNELETLGIMLPLGRDSFNLRFSGSRKSDAVKAGQKNPNLSDGELFQKLPHITKSWIECGLGKPIKATLDEGGTLPTIHPEHLLLGMLSMAEEGIEKIEHIEDPDYFPPGNQRVVFTYRTLLNIIRPLGVDVDAIPEPAKFWELLEDTRDKLQQLIEGKSKAKHKEIKFSPAFREAIEQYMAKNKYAFTSSEEFMDFLLHQGEKAKDKPSPKTAELANFVGMLEFLRDQYELLFFSPSEMRAGKEENEIGSAKANKAQELVVDDEEIPQSIKKLLHWQKELKRLASLPPEKRIMTPEQERLIQEMLDRYQENLGASMFGGGESQELQSIQERIKVIFKLPWEKSPEKPIDLAKSEALLSNSHYGLEKPKQSILEFLSVERRNARLQRAAKTGKAKWDPELHATTGKILCLVGPKGTGKTTIAKAIAKGTGRKFVKLSLNGVTDVSKLKGDRAVYVGSGPGDFFKAMIQAGANNPVILLDEFDKMQHVSHHGDPRQALLDLLDPEQNKEVTDDYVNVPYDFSNVLFILTANDIHELPPPLLDRLEIIQLRAYSDEEKIHIARRHLVPKRLKANGLKAKDVQLPRETLQYLAHYYTPEGGVRDLDRKIDTIFRKIVDRIERKPAGLKRFPKTITPDLLKTMLGPPPQFEKVKESRVGRVNGLYYSESGGGLLPILVQKRVVPLEVKTTLPGELKMLPPTGNLQKVMSESFQTAYGYIQSNLDALSQKLGARLVPDNTEVRLIPGAEEGAVTKDGPSAGAAIALAMVSRLADRRIKGDVAMTGTITYDGEIGAIGGLMEKITGAARGGAKTVLIPADNYDAQTGNVIETDGDIVPIPKDLRKKVKIVPVSHFEQVLDLALEKP